MKSAPVFLGTLALACLIAPLPEIGPAPAQAQIWWNGPPPAYYRPRVNPNRARVPKRDIDRVTRGSKKPAADAAPVIAASNGGPLLAVVSISNQRLTVYDSSGPILRSPISSGTAGHRTPTGVFSVIQKNRHHVSNIYSGAPMPFMQRITWSGIAMHAGALPGYPASHGCIRLPYPVAAKLFGMTKMGMRVIVAPHEPTATAFSHEALPEPLMVAAPAGTDGRADGQSIAAPVRVATAEGGLEAAAVASRFLNPMQNAVLERGRARARVIETTKANKDLLAEALRASADANAASAVLRAAQASADQLRGRVAAASDDARAALEAQLADAHKALEDARTTEALKSRAAYTAAGASRDAEDAQAKAEEAVKVAERGIEPIAVFVSRREGKVFVRQGMVPLFEAPVTFKEPSRPVGTHVFQVMAADGASGRLGWKSVTVPENTSFADTLDNRGPVRRGERVVAQSVGMPSDARGALERIEMAPDVKKRIAERLWVNGSIVVSDHGISNETGKGTDFVVLTR